MNRYNIKKEVVLSLKAVNTEPPEICDVTHFTVLTTLSIHSMLHENEKKKYLYTSHLRHTNTSFSLTNILSTLYHTARQLVRHQVNVKKTFRIIKCGGLETSNITK